MDAQPYLLALSGAIFPVGFAVALGFLSTEKPGVRTTALMLGSLTASLLIGAIAFVILRHTHLELHRNHTPNGFVFIALGLIALGVAWKIWRTPPKPKAKPEADTEVSTLGAFGIGMLLFLPGVSLLAAVKVVADDHESIASSTVTIVICALITLLWVEIPLITVLLFPDKMKPALDRLSNWFTEHGRAVVLALTVLVGGYLISKGIASLAS